MKGRNVSFKTIGTQQLKPITLNYPNIRDDITDIFTEN